MRSVAARLSSPSSTATIYREALPSNDPGVYTCTFPIPGNAEAGRWYVAMLYLYDRADNSKILSYSSATVPPGGTVEVSSQDSDTKPPEVRDAWVEKRSVPAGGRAQRRRHGRRLGRGERFGLLLEPFALRPHPVRCSSIHKRRWSAQVWSANADCGEWTIQMLDATDKALNMTRLQGDAAAVARASFDVSSPSCDTEPPVLESLTLSPTTVSNETASEVLVTVVVSDQGTGVSSVYADAVGPIATSGQNPRIRVFCSGNPADPAAPWTGRLVIPQYAARGTWKVDHVHLQDGASNARTYQGSDPVLADGVFEVQ